MAQRKEDEGKIYRKDGKVVVEAKGQQKIFEKKMIFLPDEYDLAVKTYLTSLTNDEVVVLAINGYSSIKADHCAAWGIKPGAYEAASAALLAGVINDLQNNFRGIDIRIVHGASNMGVDKSAIQVARDLGIVQLGFNCPKFMLYVEDDEVPVYVAKSQADYADAFINSLDILIAANGRIQAFEMDMDAAFKKRKHVIPVNIIKSISTKGGPPAFGPNNEIEDAVAAFYEQVHFVHSLINGAAVMDWEVINKNTKDIAVNICRRMISPGRAFCY